MTNYVALEVVVLITNKIQHSCISHDEIMEGDALPWLVTSRGHGASVAWTVGWSLEITGRK